MVIIFGTMWYAGMAGIAKYFQMTQLFAFFQIFYYPVNFFPPPNHHFQEVDPVNQEI
jgi:hypothetical protein